MEIRLGTVLSPFDPRQRHGETDERFALRAGLACRDLSVKGTEHGPRFFEQAGRFCVR